MKQLSRHLALEAWVLRPYARQFVLIPVFGLVFGLIQNSVIPVMTVMAAVTGSYGFNIVETSRLETLLASLPGSRRLVVAARYLLTGLVVVASGLAGFGIDAAWSAAREQPWSATGSVAVLLISLAVAAVLVAVQFPFFFRLGYSRARPVTLISGCVVVGLVVLSSLGASALTIPDASVVAAAWIGVAAAAAGLAASVVVSTRIYTRKDL